MAGVIWKLAAIDPAVGKIITDQIDLQRRFSVAVKLCGELHVDSRVAKAVKNAQKVMKPLIEQRNIVIHGQHIFVSGENPAIQSCVTRSFTRFDDEEILNLAGAIAKAGADLANQLIKANFIEGVDLTDCEDQFRSMFVPPPS